MYVEEILNKLYHNWGRILIDFIQIGKMIPIDCDKLCICNVIPKASIKKATQRYTQKHYR